ncbi:MAG TPA: RagB/SusD family nutrient uptake outer membrane protein [Chitinophagaceae bacterium]|nr:RagB/SusD family nutrient uptake outer membrane protein [Chitinophagaceae bacterium]
MKSLRYILIASTIIIATACNKKLDVLPQQNITPDEIKTSDDVKAVLFGTYSLLQGPNGFGERYILIPDLIANNDQVDFIGTFTDYRDISRKVQDKTNVIAAGLWAGSYSIINVTNTVLDKISLVTADERDAVEGEAKFVRGVAYFELVNFFAKPYSAGNVSTNPGVPLTLNPVYVYDSTKDKPSRATIDAVYSQIVKDFSDAAQKLPETADNGRATKYAAEAFLARVYMNMGDYANAAAMANDVIASGDYSLSTSFENEYNNIGPTSEDIFSILQTSQSNAGTTNNGLSTFYQPQPGGRGDAQVDPAYFNRFDDANDDRGSFFYLGISIAGDQGIYTGKWADFYKVIPVIRLSEMYLTRGEANLHLGGVPVGGVAPVQDYNIVRRRAHAASVAAVTTSDFVEERFRELGFEGDRLWTLKRLQMQVGNRAYDDNKLVMPIPQTELDVNSNLVQNAGY